MKDLLFICLFFCKLSISAFGGGYSLIPLIEKEIVERRKLLSSEDITNLFAIGGSAPGAVVINIAILIGYKIKGVIGAILCTLSITLPVFLLAIGCSFVVDYFIENIYIRGALVGLQSAVVALVVYAAFRLYKTALIDTFTISLFSISLILLFLKINAIYVIVFTIFIGIILVFLSKEETQNV
ncbi:chromate transporter [Ureibacillus xyleni]|uniref:Chromate transporter n=1 Tax=Ureibacillus xyleni TaxID=614648 RepID=A0A285RX32_9BACL|nr:chromate transporter [Ureibacillus xyleni]SOB98851.1 chromate transporter [Ureibacillus xyleni]